MADGRKTLVIGSRESALAVRQSQIVMAYLEKEHPEICLRLETMRTTGDRILERRLDEIGGKGLFVKELDQALREGRIDLSVHSMKDMPIETPEDLPVIGCSRREDPGDVLVLPAGTDKIRSGKEQIKEYLIENADRPIGTSSRRRILQVQTLFPEARFESVRGNLATRLRKLDEGQYSALILAGAGLKRLGWENRISYCFAPDEVVPSAGQGILALQGRKGEDYSFLDGFCDRDSAFAVAAERAFVCALGGGCTSPIAAHAALEWMESGKKVSEEAGAQGAEPGCRKTEALMTLRGFFYDESSRKAFRKRIQTVVRSEDDCVRAGRALAQEILQGGERGTLPVPF